MNQRMFTSSRIIAVVCSAALSMLLLLPIWRIELTAPQYPEGLVLEIYAHRLGGDVEVVNGLNHYIGMRTLHEKDFVEFQVLPYIVGCLIIFGLLSAVVNRKWFFYVWVVCVGLFAAVAMIDFYRWEYNYGHNLDPAAPIQVPGMSYQPPLIGYKQLLNFGAFSIPGAGGWCFAGAVFLLLATGIREFRSKRLTGNRRIAKTSLVGALFVLLLTGCSNGPQPIKFGYDNCDFCKMTISDTHFGGELVTDKGKLYKFDDIHCLTSFRKSNPLYEKSAVYLIDYSTNGALIRADQSFLLKSQLLHGPMGGNIAAFAREDSLKKFNQLINGDPISYHELFK